MSKHDKNMKPAAAAVSRDPASNKAAKDATAPTSFTQPNDKKKK